MTKAPPDLPEHLHFQRGEDPRSRRWDPLLEVVITVALGLAAVVTALSLYLNERSDHESQVKFNETIEHVNASTASATQAVQMSAQDHSVFAVYSSLYYDKGPNFASYLIETAMSERLRKMVHWWANTKGSGRTPFTKKNPYYTHPDAKLAAHETEAAEAAFADAKAAQNDASDYVLIEVILATALFLYGIAGVTRRFTIRIGTLGAGAFIFVIACVLLIAV
jgi:hypothetical protein